MDGCVRESEGKRLLSTRLLTWWLAEQGLSLQIQDCAKEALGQAHISQRTDLMPITVQNNQFTVRAILLSHVYDFPTIGIQTLERCTLDL